MPTFKNIRIKKRGGGTRTQRVKVLASGKYRFVKNPTSSRKTTRRKTSRTRKANPTRRRGVRRMARRKKRRGGGGRNITGKVFKWIRIGALAAPMAARILDPDTAGKEKVERIIQDYTGFNVNDQEFRFEYLAKGWLPYLGAVAATYGIPKIASILRRL